MKKRLLVHPPNFCVKPGMCFLILVGQSEEKKLLKKSQEVWEQDAP